MTRILLCLAILIPLEDLVYGEANLLWDQEGITVCPDPPIIEVGVVTPVCQRIVPIGTKITITCHSSSPVEFFCPVVFDVDETKEEIFICNDDMIMSREFNGRYNSTLTIEFARHLHTGMYTCKTKTSNSSQYIFVEDKNRLLLPMKPVYRIDEVLSVIPCKPTHPNVRVHLRHKASVPHQTNSKQLAFDSPHHEQDAKDLINSSWTYDPRKGFRLSNLSQMSSVAGQYECQAEKQFTDYWHRVKIEFQIQTGKTSEDPSVSDDENDLNVLVKTIASWVIFVLGILVIILGLILKKIIPTAKVSSLEDGLPIDPRWEFPRGRLNLLHQLGLGNFGSVIKAEATRIRSYEPVTTVALKTNRWDDGIHALIAEINILTHVGRHLNVVTFLGACTHKNRPEDRLFIIFEYCPYGNLREHLIQFRRRFISQVDEHGNLIGSRVDDGQQHYDSTKRNSSITTRDLIYWAYQISRGMVYLVKEKILHRDLAARNILLSDNSIVKISDFGLSRKNEENCAQQKDEVVRLAYKWMAIEVHNGEEYTCQSDVWSFGVVLWEMFTLGIKPYEGITDANHLIQLLQMGCRLKKPQNAPRLLCQLMSSCWHEEPHRRPTFSELEQNLGEQVEISMIRHFIVLGEKFAGENEKSESSSYSICCFHS